MTGGREPREERRRLAAELRRLRAQAGISGREMAARIDMSQSKVSRIELGSAMPTMPQVVRWAQITDASSEKTKSLIGLAERAFTEIHTWRASLQARPHLQHEIREREARARMSRTYQPLVVPGLLQTAEYARQVFSLSPLPNVREEIPAAVAGRMDRQLALYEPGRRFEFLISEPALRWRPGPDAHRVLPAQLDRVASLSTLANVSIGIVPESRPAIAYASHGFVIYDGHEADTTVVTMEAIHGSLTFHDPESIDIYEHTWAALARMAVFDDDARGILAGVAADVRVITE